MKTEDYHGTALSVAATSLRQAYAVAYKDIWINPEHRHPVGIVSVYRRSTGFTLWCGCTGHSVTGGGVEHQVPGYGRCARRSTTTTATTRPRS